MTEELDTLKVTIRVDRVRFNKIVSCDELIGMQEGQVRSIRDVLAKFLVNENGDFYPTRFDEKTREIKPSDEAVRVIGRLSIDEMTTASQNFLKTAQDEAVPPVNASD